MQSSAALKSYQLNVKIGNQMPTPSSPKNDILSSTFASNSSRKTSCSDNASDIIDADYIDKNIPKMELLTINYVSRSRNSLATASPEEHDLIQLRAKKRLHPKQQLYQRSHSDGFLKVSELAKLSGYNSESHSDHNSSNKLSSHLHTKTQSPKVNQPSTQTPTAVTPHHTNPLKYTVYKRHNAPDASTQMKSEKLQYTNDDAIFKANKKKYSMFDSRKRNMTDNIQFYFDSKSYERHVDNKMYGVLMSNASQNNEKTPIKSHSNTMDSKTSVKRLAPAAPPSSYENKSNSWNFVKATRSLLNHSNIGRMASGQKYTKNVPSSKKSMSREASLVDLTRIGQIFKENTRRASADDLLDGCRLPVNGAYTPKSKNEMCNGAGENKTASTSKKIKKLSIDFENKCLCDYRPKQLHGVTERKTSAPAQMLANENAPRIRRKLEFPSASIDSIHKTSDEYPPALPPKNIKRLSKCSSVDYDDGDDVIGRRSEKSGFYLLNKTRSKSITSIEHGVPLFGHFQSGNSNCATTQNTCGYKNCTFVNCPMSSITAALSNVNREKNNDKICLKTTINANDKYEKNTQCVDGGKMKATATTITNSTHNNNNNISITKIDTISNKSKLYLKTKDFNDDGDDLLKEFEMNGNGDGMQSIALNNLKNLKNTTNLHVNGKSVCGGGTTIPIKFTPNQQNLNNSMKCKSVEKLDFNSTSTIEDKKFNNVQPSSSPSDKTMSFNKGDDDNRVKIFIRNPPLTQHELDTVTSKKRSSASSCSSASSPVYESSSTESTSDYYDSVPAEDDIDYQTIANDAFNDADCMEKLCKTNTTEVPEIKRKCNLNNFGIVPTTKLLTPTANNTSSKQINELTPSTNLTTSNGDLKNLFPSRLGCDGAIFWNDCFYYDEHACCDCKTPNDYEKLTNGSSVDQVNKGNDDYCACKNRYSKIGKGEIDDDDDIDDGYDETKQVEI